MGIKTGRLYTHAEIIDYLRSQIGFRKSALDLAKDLGLSQAMLSELLNEKKYIGTKTAKALGLEIRYIKSPNN